MYITAMIRLLGSLLTVAVVYPLLFLFYQSIDAGHLPTKEFALILAWTTAMTSGFYQITTQIMNVLIERFDP